MCAKKALTEQTIFFSNDYYSDMSDKQMQYAVLLRSPVSHAKKFTFSIPDLPEGYKIFSAKDIPGKNEILTNNQRCKVFCDSNIEYKGQVIAILTGQDVNVLEQLKKSLIFTTEEAENISDNQEISQQKNIVLTKTLASKGFSQDLFKSGLHIVTSKWKSDLVETMVSEREGVFVKYEDESVHVFSHAPWITHLKQAIKSVTKFSESKIQITRTKSNALVANYLWQTSLMCAQVCVAAVNLKQSVKLILSSEEQQKFVLRPLLVEVSHSTAVDDEGKMHACDVEIEVNAGSFSPLADEILERMVVAALGVYSPLNFRVNASIIKTNDVPASTTWNRIDAPIYYAIECQIQKICENIGLSPLEVRKQNIDFSKKSKLPYKIDIDRFDDVLTAVATKSDFLRKYVVYRLDEKDRYEQENVSPFRPPLRGIGFACGFEASAYNSSRFLNKNFSLVLTFEKDNVLKIKTTPLSASIILIWKKIACQKLEIPEEKLQFVCEFENNYDDILDTISADISLNTQLFIDCLDDIKLSAKKSKFPCVASHKMSDLIIDDWNPSKFTGHPYYSISSAACVVELELDPCTYQQQIRGIYICINAGKIHNPKIAEKAIKKAIRNTLANIVVDEIIQCENINVMFVQSTEKSRQLGEIVFSVLPSAFASALSQALSYSVKRLPIATDTIYKISAKAKMLYDEKQELTRLSQVEELKIDQEINNPENNSKGEKI